MTELNYIANIYREIFRLLDNNHDNLESCALIAEEFSNILAENNTDVPHIEMNEYFGFLYDLKQQQTSEQYEYLMKQSVRFRSMVEDFIREYAYEHEE